MECAPHWKRIWMTVNGRRDHIGISGASTAIDLIKKELITGLTIYEPYTEDSYKRCLEKLDDLNNSGCQETIKKLSIALKLDACTTWAVLCNYLKFECYIDTENMNDIVKYLLNHQKINIELWQFFQLERMFMLKIFHSILENCRNTSHQFYGLYKKFVDEFSLKAIRESLFKQFSLLSKEIEYDHRHTCLNIKDWVERNSREQLQILYNILTALRHEKCDVGDFIKLLKLFREPNSAFQSYTMDAEPISNLSNQQAITNMEIGIVLSNLEEFWHNSDMWYSRCTEIETEIVELCQMWNSPVLLLAWVALHLTVPLETASLNSEAQLQSYLRTALHSNAFSDLHEVVSNGLFKDSSVGLTVKMAIFIILEVLCIKLGPNTIYDHEGTVTLLGKLLTIPEIAVVWHEGIDDGAKSFYNIAVSLFPLHFLPLSIFVKSLINLNWDTEGVIRGLTNLQLYTEKYNKPAIHMLNKECQLHEVYEPLKNVVFEIGTRLTIENRNKENVIQFHARYSYFKVFIHIVDNLLKQLQEYRVNVVIEKGVEAGYKIILETLKVKPSLITDNPDVQSLLKSSFYILNAVAKPQVNNVPLVTVCFEILVYQFELNPHEVQNHLTAIKFLPVLLTEFSTEEVFYKLHTLSEASINNFTSDLFSSSSCDLICLYIKLVKKAIQKKLFVKEIVHPGIMFLITKHFPKFATQFSGGNDKTRKVCCKLVSLCHLILQKNRALLTEDELFYFDCLINLFAKKKLYAVALVSYFQISNVQLELILSVETNYTSGPLLKLVKSVKRALHCISNILKCIHLTKQTYDWFEDYLWHFSPGGSILSYVAEYKSHSFDTELPCIAWDILTNFALVSKRPLLQAFKVGSKEIRQWILQNLNDPLITDNVKLSIINFIKACIYEQASMIAAFFNIEDYQLDPQLEESVAEYMNKYLSNIAKDVTILSQPLQLGILELFHVLWKTNKKHIIKRILDEESFWISMSAPLLKPERLPQDAIILTLEIFILELCDSKENVSSNFNAAMTKIFDGSNKFIEMWIYRAAAITEIDNLNAPPPGQLSLAVVLVTVLKKFLLVVQRFYPSYEKVWNTHALEKKCLETLLYCNRSSENCYLVTLWAEFCLVFSTAKEKKETEIYETLDCMANILSGYVELSKRMGDNDVLTILALTFMALKNSHDIVSEESALTERFLLPIMKMFYFEHTLACMNDKNEERKLEKFYYKWIIILKMMNMFLKMKHIKQFKYLFIKYSYLDKVFEVVYLFIKNKWPVRVAIATVNNLICYVDSELDHHFDRYSENIIDRLTSPEMYRLDLNTLKWGKISQEITDHWKLYTHVIRLNEILLRRRGSFVVNYLLLFIESHALILSNAILSITTVLTEDNLQLTCHILHFVHDLLKYFRKWPTVHYLMFEPIMTAVNHVLNVGSNIFAQPTIVMFTLESDTYKTVPYSEVPEANLINIINSYLEIITWSFMCFNQSNPSFENLLHFYQDTNYRIRIKYDFRFAPQNTTNNQHLSFNILLPILNFLCNILTRVAYDGKQVEEDGKPVLKDYIALLYPWDKKDNINAFVTMADDSIIESYGAHINWLTRLNTDLLLEALSALNTFLATQIFLATRNPRLRYDEVYYMRRQLCSDLLCFYKFVNNLLSNSAFSKLQVPQTSTHSKTYLVGDVSKICCNEEGVRTPITSIDNSYFLVLTHWFKHVCKLVYSSKFDEMLFQLNAKTMRIVYNQIYAEN